MQEPAHNYARVVYGGKTVNVRTRIMLDAAAELFGKRWTLSQGSYNRGGVAASAGTHDGGGVVDVSVLGMSTDDRARAVQCLRRVGFFAWLRVPPAFVYHIHAVAIGDRELAPVARAQVVQGFADRDGLARRGPDPDKDPYPEWVDHYGRHVSLDRPEAPVPDAPSGSYEPFPGIKFFSTVKDSPIYAAMGKRLVAEGCGLYKEGPGPELSDTDRASYEKFMRKLGLTGDDAKWPPGPWSWSKLRVPNV